MYCHGDDHDHDYEDDDDDGDEIQVGLTNLVIITCRRKRISIAIKGVTVNNKALCFLFAKI